MCPFSSPTCEGRVTHLSSIEVKCKCRTWVYLFHCHSVVPGCSICVTNPNLGMFLQDAGKSIQMPGEQTVSLSCRTEGFQSRVMLPSQAKKGGMLANLHDKTGMYNLSICLSVSLLFCVLPLSSSFPLSDFLPFFSSSPALLLFFSVK